MPCPSNVYSRPPSPPGPCLDLTRGTRQVSRDSVSSKTWLRRQGPGAAAGPAHTRTDPTPPCRCTNGRCSQRPQGDIARWVICQRIGAWPHDSSATALAGTSPAARFWAADVIPAPTNPPSPLSRVRSGPLWFSSFWTSWSWPEHSPCRGKALAAAGHQRHWPGTPSTGTPNMRCQSFGAIL